ncbi:MAG: outer membrane beta-barrel protein [Mangrovibacterium sp.]
MKRLYFVLFLSLLFIGGYAQDLLITNTNDSINCKITAEKSNLVYFNFMHQGEFRKTLLAKRNVKQIVYNYFDEAIVEPQEVKRAENFNRFRVSLNGGIGYRTARNPDDLPDFLDNYADGLKWGGCFSADAGYFINESIGLGLKYNYFGSSNSMQNVTMDVNYDGYPETGAMSDNINISFVGPMVSSMVYSGNRKNAFFFNLALGYLHYLDKGELIGYDVKMKGSTVGFVGDIGYQIGLSDALSLAFTCSYTIGTLSKMKIELGDASYTVKPEDDKKENLGRIELTVGLVFHR